MCASRRGTSTSSCRAPSRGRCSASRLVVSVLCLPQRKHPRAEDAGLRGLLAGPKRGTRSALFKRRTAPMKRFALSALIAFAAAPAFAETAVHSRGILRHPRCRDEELHHRGQEASDYHEHPDNPVDYRRPRRLQDPVRSGGRHEEDGGLRRRLMRSARISTR